MFLRFVAFLLPLLLPGALIAGPDPAPYLLPETLANVLYVRAGDSTGTAFLLRHGDDRYLVTARHVVEACLEDSSVPLQFLVGGRHGRLLRGIHLLKEDRRADIAVYTFEEDPRMPCFPANAGLVPTGDLHLASQVFLVGYPASLRQTYGSTQLRVVGGWIAGLRKYVPGSTVEYVDIDMPGVEHGHSGGPILLLQDHVLAVAVQRRTGSVSDTIGATYAVPIGYVTALIDGEPLPEDTNALNEMLRGTTLVCGLALHGKNDYDVWTQRIHRDTGEGVWGDMGIFVASSPSQEAAFYRVPSDDGSTLVVHTAVYGEDADHDILVQKVSRYGELLFETGMRSRPVAVRTQKERRPVAVSDGAAGAIVVYEIHLDDGDIDVMAQRIAPGGDRLWNEHGNVVSSAKLVERNPSMVSDGSGGAIVALEMHLEGDDIDVRAQRIRPNGTLAWHEGKKSALVASADAPETNPRLVTDGDGGAIIVYEVRLDSGSRVLLAQRVSHHGELLWNGGESGVVVSALPLAGGRDGVTVLPDGLGGAFVAMEVRTDGQNPGDVDIAMQRLSPDGRALWGKADEGEVVLPVLVASSPWPERRPVLLADGQGGLVVAFETGSAEGDLDVFAQRVGADGVLGWHNGERSAEVAFTALSEHTPRFVERHRDRILLVFEVERENGRGTVACQALSLQAGKVLYGVGRFPIAVLDPGDAEVSYLLHVPDTGD